MPFNEINEAFRSTGGKQQNNSTYEIRLIKIKVGKEETSFN